MFDFGPVVLATQRGVFDMKNHNDKQNKVRIQKIELVWG